MYNITLHITDIPQIKVFFRVLVRDGPHRTVNPFFNLDMDFLFWGLVVGHSKIKRLCANWAVSNLLTLNHREDLRSNPDIQEWVLPQNVDRLILHNFNFILVDGSWVCSENNLDCDIRITDHRL